MAELFDGKYEVKKLMLQNGTKILKGYEAVSTDMALLTTRAT